MKIILRKDQSHMLRKYIFSFICFALMLFMLCACASEKNDSSTLSGSNTESTVAESSQEESRPLISSSSLTSPLGIDTYSSAAKYCTSENKYVNVPVKLTSLVRGKDAEKEIKSYAESTPSFTYKAPEKGTEWVLIEYSMNLDSFPTDKKGIDNSITAFVTDKGGEGLVLNGKQWSTTPVNMTDGKYYFYGEVSGKTAFLMIKDKKDFVIALGEFGETQAYFSPSVKS